MAKDVRVTITITEEQRARWKAEADARNMSLPAFIRHCTETYLTLMERVKKK